MLFLAFLCLPVTAVLPESRIVGGGEAVPHSHPSIASLQQLGSAGQYFHHCGASLVATEWALTAAHCVQLLKRENLRIHFGEHSLAATEASEQIRSISKVIVHPLYDSMGDGIPHDIALLKLSSPVTITPEVGVIPLPPSASASYDGQVATIAGWGRLSGGGLLPDKLQEVKMDVVSNPQCKSMWTGGDFADIADYHICIFDGSASSCNMDSGGPMVASSGELIGVTSWGDHGCSGQKPSVYARVSYYLNWIHSNIN